VRVLVADRITGSFNDWPPLFGSLIEAQEALLIVTPGIDSPDLLKGICTNTMENRFFCCPIFPPPEHSGDLLSLAEKLSAVRHGLTLKQHLPYLTSGSVTSPLMREDLPLLHRVVARRHATIGEPAEGNDWA
jgi:hypothetical protein